MPSFNVLGLFPPIGDFRFTPEDAQVDPNFKVGGIPDFYQYAYNDPVNTQYWQTYRPYFQKKTFNDPCTVFVQTARAGTTTPIYPFLELVDVCETVSISLMPFVNGAQRIDGNKFTKPGTGIVIPLDSFSYKFTMGLILDPATQSGFYRVKATIYGDDASTVYNVWLSEIIEVYDNFPGTALIQGFYNTNNTREGVITGGWADGQLLSFFTRVECSFLDYNLQGVMIGYYQQSYLELVQQDESWNTWVFELGGAAGGGVTNYDFQRVDKLLGTGNALINGRSYTKYENSDSPKFAWSKTDPNTSGLIWAKIPIREKHLGENVYLFQTPTPDITIFTPDGYPFAVPRWYLIDGMASLIRPPAVIDDIGEYAAYVAVLNGLPGLGSYFLSGTTLKYTPDPSMTAYLFAPVDLLYLEFDPSYKPSLSGGANGVRIAGFGCAVVIEWGDGSAVEYYTFPDFTPHDIPHTFAASAFLYNARVFHNDILTQLVFNESGIYPISNVFLEDVTGVLPALLVGLDLAACSNLGGAGGGAINIDIAPCTNLNSLSFRSNPLLKTFTIPLFAPSIVRPALAYLEFKNNQLSSATTDTLFNDYTANSWNGTLPSGDFIVQNSPAAAPTAASLTARNELIALSWNVLVDP